MDESMIFVVIFAVLVAIRIGYVKGKHSIEHRAREERGVNDSAGDYFGNNVSSGATGYYVSTATGYCINIFEKKKGGSAQSKRRDRRRIARTPE